MATSDREDAVEQKSPVVNGVEMGWLLGLFRNATALLRESLHSSSHRNSSGRYIPSNQETETMLH